MPREFKKAVRGADLVDPAIKRAVVEDKKRDVTLSIYKLSKKYGYSFQWIKRWLLQDPVTSKIVRGREKGAARPTVVPPEALLAFIKQNPTHSTKDIGEYFGVRKETIQTMLLTYPDIEDEFFKHEKTHRYRARYKARVTDVTHDMIYKWRKNGMRLRQIAKRLGMKEQTVRKYFREACIERGHRWHETTYPPKFPPLRIPDSWIDTEFGEYLRAPLYDTEEREKNDEPADV